MIAGDHDPPSDLITSIVNGRCVAFVGAGLAACVMPEWSKLLEDLAARLEARVEVPPGANALQYEAIGQHLCNLAGERWEPLVQRSLEDFMARASVDNQRTLARRRELLLQIPFKAILTTNFDPSLPPTHSSLDPRLYNRVLREDRGRWWNAPQGNSERADPVPVIKLHGHANGLATELPLVLARADYRKRIYEDRNYANFIRSVFAEYTVLFLGVSFTDAYLNELRSEILHLIHDRQTETEWGYAIVHRPGELFRAFLQKEEGIRVLPTQEHAEFDGWLECIASRTSITGRLQRILRPGARIVWVDPNHEANNQEGHRLLSAAAAIEPVRSPADLDHARHGAADLILTSFGHREGLAFRVLDEVRTWKERPPVIVFAARGREEVLAENRRQCLRRGAWEYTTEWSELYRAIELVVGRVPGRADAY